MYNISMNYDILINYIKIKQNLLLVVVLYKMEVLIKPFVKTVCPCCVRFLDVFALRLSCAICNHVVLV